MEEERRKEERRKVMAFTPVYDVRLERLIGYLGDLTLQGALVIGPHPLEADARLLLGIEFPGTLEGIAARRMVVPARVARCLPDAAPGSHRIGFEFTEVGPEQAAMIAGLLERYHFRHRIGSSE